MKHFKLLLLVLISVSCSKPKTENTSFNFSIGIVTDCQYCDCPVKWNRYFKDSPDRLQKSVTELNQHKLAFTIHLGDFIDRDFSSFDTVKPIWEQLKSPTFHVLGNHDFSVADSLKPLVFDKMKLKNRYYSFEEKNWKFIVLDGNDLSFHGALDSPKIKQTDSLFSLVKSEQKPYAEKYNGGLSRDQLVWVENELKSATEKKQSVGFFCHFPIHPVSNHNIWNTDEFITLIQKYPAVKVFMNGHNHSGAYSLINGVHYITYKGMVDTADSTAFSIANFTKDSIFIKGFGREESKRLVLKTL